MLQDQYYTGQYPQESFLGRVLINASQVGGRISDIGERTDDKIINQARSLDYNLDLSSAVDQAESNLTARKIKQAGGRAASWLSVPQNLALTVLIVIAVLFGVRKL